MKKIFIIILTSFLAGVGMTQSIHLFWTQLFNKSVDSHFFLNQNDLDLTAFWEVYKIIENDFYASWAIEKKDLVEWAIEWMVHALWDKHSEFMNPDVTQKFNESLSGDFEWIGAVVEKAPLWVIVERVIKGSPAKKYDVRPWDIIIEANGKKLEDLDLYDAVDKIKGPAGSEVILTLIREGEEQLLKITLLREKIHIPSVEEKYFPEDKIAYISINMFGDSTVDEFKEAVSEMEKQDVESIILDVRDNGGWYLQSAVEILSYFIEPNQVVVKTKYKNPLSNIDYFSLEMGKIIDKKMVVLINGNSASASEITAGALREYDTAILVWEQTYGKGSVQQPFEMLDGSLLKLTVAKWFTPNGRNIDDEGISPDITIHFEEEDYTNVYDRQLEEAKKILDIWHDKWSIWLTIEAYSGSLEKK